MKEQGNRAARYARISFDKASDEHGVANQLADQERMAAARGYQVVMTETDNDISAFTGRHRPGYERIMAAAAAGGIDVILVFQTSRFWRNREERAKGIRILKDAGVSLIATRGPSLDMSTAYGRAMAGLLGEFDTMESEIKGERQQLLNEQNARAGKPRLATHRPFGWRDDRLTADPAEAAAIRDACRALLAGGTVSGVARDWALRGLRPHQSGSWTRTSVRTILTSPRIAGISVYNGEQLGRGQWQPVVPEETWRAVCDLLGDGGRRRKNAGVTTLLGGIARCRCGNHVTATLNSKGRPSYRCNPATRDGRPGPHVHVRRADVDEHISAVIAGLLASPDVTAFLGAEARDGVAALRDEAAGLRARRGRLAELYASGHITEADLLAGRRKADSRLAELESQLSAIGRDGALTALLTAADAAAAWTALGTDVKRGIIDALMTITLHPSEPGTRTFDPGVVLPPGKGITWKS